MFNTTFKVGAKLWFNQGGKPKQCRVRLIRLTIALHWYREKYVVIYRDDQIQRRRELYHNHLFATRAECARYIARLINP